MVLLELFSGIGGFSKGLQAAGYSFEKVYFSEIEKNAIANFKYNFPYAEHIGSVTEIGTAGKSASNVPTLSLSEALARILVQSATAAGCVERQVPLSGMLSKPSGDSDLTFLSGRMLRESSSQSIDQIFGALSKRLPTLAVIDLNGNCSIRHGFYPRTERESTLSDVLQTGVPEMYFLSRRRVDGIIRAGKTRFIPIPAER